MVPAASLSTLAPEVLQLIIENTHASGHWPLAQSCKYIYLHSQPILNLHRKAQEKYKITSDLDPSTVPSLLLSAFGYGKASIEAWHVREFESWHESSSGLPYKVDSDTGKVTEVRDKEPWSLPSEDISHLCTKLLKLQSLYGEHQKLNEKVSKSLQHGSSSWVKAILLAYLPRLRALRYAQVDDRRYPRSLVNLCGLIYRCKSNETWLGGLESLQEVAVCIRLDRVDDAIEPHHLVKRRADEFCRLLCLPNLSKVYFSHLDGSLYFEILKQDTSFPNGIQPPLDKTSPVQTIILDTLEYELCYKLVKFLASIPQSLQNLAICFSRSNEGEDTSIIRELVTELAKYQRHSLQRLCIHTEDGGMRSSSENWLCAELLRPFEDLRVVNLDWSGTQCELDPANDMTWSELLRRLLEVFQYHLPSRMELIDFKSFHYDLIFDKGKIDDIGFDYIDDIIEAMIKSGRYKNLKVINLKRLQSSAFYRAGATISFPKSIKAAEEPGIYVRIEGSIDPQGFSRNGEFVSFPRRDCMVTGRFMAEDRGRLRGPARTRSPSPFWESE